MSDLVHVIAAVVLSWYFLFGTVANALVVHVFRKSKQLVTPTDRLISVLSWMDLVMASIATPFVMLSSLAGRWLFGHVGCLFYAFLMTVLGIANISLLAMIAVTRYIAVVKTDRAENIACKHITAIVLGCVLHGFIWGIGPIFGWGAFGEEPMMTSCAPTWWTSDLIEMSYIFSQFLFVFCLPLVMIMASYIRIFSKVRGSVAPGIERNRRREMKLVTVVIAMIASFLICWSPYALFAFISAAGQSRQIMESFGIIPVLMAKSSCIWNPLIYATRHQLFRREAILILGRPCDPRNSSSTSSQSPAITRATPADNTNSHHEVKTKLKHHVSE